MNPEMKFVLRELIAELEALRLKTNSLAGHVDAQHPDARQIADATDFIQDAVNSLQKIGFGLESEISYDD